MIFKGNEQTEAEKERILLITIKELIARVRHNPIESQDFLTEFEVSSIHHDFWLNHWNSM